MLLGVKKQLLCSIRDVWLQHWPCPSASGSAASSSPPSASRIPPSAPFPAGTPPGLHGVRPLAPPPAAGASGQTGCPGCGSSEGSRPDSLALHGGTGDKRYSLPYAWPMRHLGVNKGCMAALERERADSFLRKLSGPRVMWSVWAH